MPKYFKAQIGTYDYLPDKYPYFRFIRKAISHRFKQNGFLKIDTPLFEELKSYEQSIGIDSEVFQKELYTFEDRHERKYALRPEITTSVIRAFIEHEMYKNYDLPVQLYYMGPCFRFERIKSNYQRSFWQFGGEILGGSDPAIDAQLMYLAHTILQDLGVRNSCDLVVNSFGNEEDREKYKEALANFYSDKIKSLSEGTKQKLEQKKFLSILANPQTEDEEILLEISPKITDFLSTESKKYFEEVKEYLNLFKVPYIVDPKLFRPLNYYAHTIFEFREKQTRNKICVGGRYDGLIKNMSGPDMGGAGFSAGIERVIDLMEKNEINVSQKNQLQIFVAATGPIAKKQALPLLIQLLNEGFNAIGNLGKSPMEDLIRRAEKTGIPYVLLIGDLEIKKNIVLMRDMKTGKKEEITFEKIIEHLKTKIQPIPREQN